MNSELGTYDDIAPIYNSLHLFEQLQKLKIIKDLLKIKPNDKVLDLGCGTGISARVLHCQLVGIDKSKGMISIAEESFPEHKWVVGEAENLPFKNEEFDKLICVTAIHNFTDIQKAAEEIRRVVKKSANSNIAVSVLRKSSKYNEVEEVLRNNFKIDKIVLESKDKIYFIKRIS